MVYCLYTKRIERGRYEQSVEVIEYLQRHPEIIPKLIRHIGSTSIAEVRYEAQSLQLENLRMVKYSHNINHSNSTWLEQGLNLSLHQSGFFVLLLRPNRGLGEQVQTCLTWDTKNAWGQLLVIVETPTNWISAQPFGVLQNQSKATACASFATKVLSPKNWLDKLRQKTQNWRDDHTRDDNKDVKTCLLCIMSLSLHCERLPTRMNVENQFWISDMSDLMAIFAIADSKKTQKYSSHFLMILQVLLRFLGADENSATPIPSAKLTWMLEHSYLEELVEKLAPTASLDAQHNAAYILSGIVRGNFSPLVAHLTQRPAILAKIFEYAFAKPEVPQVRIGQILIKISSLSWQ